MSDHAREKESPMTREAHASFAEIVQEMHDYPHLMATFHSGDREPGTTAEAVSRRKVDAWRERLSALLTDVGLPQPQQEIGYVEKLARIRRFKATTGALYGGNDHPDRCVCQRKETGPYAGTPHQHYQEPPFGCARCGGACKGYEPEVSDKPSADVLLRGEGERQHEKDQEDLETRVDGERQPDQPLTATLNNTTPTTVPSNHVSNEHPSWCICEACKRKPIGGGAVSEP